MFNENSVVVNAWVRRIRDGAVERKDVPQLSNLRDVVFNILDNNREDDQDVQ